MIKTKNNFDERWNYQLLKTINATNIKISDNNVMSYETLKDNIMKSLTMLRFVEFNEIIDWDAVDWIIALKFIIKLIK